MTIEDLRKQGVLLPEAEGGRDGKGSGTGPWWRASHLNSGGPAAIEEPRYPPAMLATISSRRRRRNS